MTEIEARIDELRARCKDEGIPLTQQRLEVYRALITAKDHPSPETLYNRLIGEFPTLSLATIYNNLETLGRLGFVRRLNPLSDNARYDGDLSSHTHFVCVSCKKIEDMDDEEVIDDDIPEAFSNGNKVISKTIQYVGICKECQISKLEEK